MTVMQLYAAVSHTLGVMMRFLLPPSGPQLNDEGRNAPAHMWTKPAVTTKALTHLDLRSEVT